MATTTMRKPTKSGPKAAHAVRDAAEVQTNNMIALLEAGQVPWQKPWSADDINLPTSLSSLKSYSGSNIFTLMWASFTNGWSSPYFGTFKQIKDRGGRIRGGEKGTPIVLVRTAKKTVTNEETGEAEEKKYGLLRIFHVFNVEQADWSPEAKLPKPKKRVRTVEAIDFAEEMVAEYITTLQGGLGFGGNSAHYVPKTDHVQMPHRDSFATSEHFYSTLYHELTHSTGHDSREKREGIAAGTFGSFGSPVYSREELVAEMGAAILCLLAGINQAATAPASAAYLDHWIKALKGDKRLIMEAASAAQKGVDRIVGKLPVADDQEEDES